MRHRAAFLSGIHRSLRREPGGTQPAWSSLRPRGAGGPAPRLVREPRGHFPVNAPRARAVEIAARSRASTRRQATPQSRRGHLSFGAPARRKTLGAERGAARASRVRAATRGPELCGPWPPVLRRAFPQMPPRAASPWGDLQFDWRCGPQLAALHASAPCGRLCALRDPRADRRCASLSSWETVLPERRPFPAAVQRESGWPRRRRARARASPGPSGVASSREPGARPSPAGGSP